MLVQDSDGQGGLLCCGGEELMCHFAICRNITLTWILGRQMDVAGGSRGCTGSRNMIKKHKTWNTMRTLISQPLVSWLMAGDHVNEIMFAH
jgi:hypothetical protein